MQRSFFTLSFLFFYGLLAHAEGPGSEPAMPKADDQAEQQASVVHPVATETPVPNLEKAQEPANRLVAVLDLRASKETEASARALSVLVTSEVAATSGYRAVSRNDLRNLLAHQSDAQMLGCDDVKCMSDIAKLAAADLLVAGTVEKIKDAYVFSLQLIDPVNAKVLERQTATWTDSPDRLVELARPMVARILAGTAGQQMSGELEIMAPEKAILTLDGESLGLAPIEHPIKHLSTGAHTVEASLDGFVAYKRQVVIVNNERSLLRVELIDADSLKPWYSRWWVWGSVGGGLALVGGATAAVLAYQATQNTPPTRLELVGELPVGVE